MKACRRGRSETPCIRNLGSRCRSGQFEALAAPPQEAGWVKNRWLFICKPKASHVNDLLVDIESVRVETHKTAGSRNPAVQPTGQHFTHSAVTSCTVIIPVERSGCIQATDVQAYSGNTTYECSSTVYFYTSAGGKLFFHPTGTRGSFRGC